MRPLWNGTLAFGLVVIPVRLYAATERKAPSFNMLHKICGTPIKYLKWCSTCNKEVEPDQIAKAYQYSKGEYVTITDDEMESIPGSEAHSIEIMDFVNLTEVDPVYYEKSYFLEPREGAEKAYALLLSSMSQEGKVAVARVSIRAKETLAMVRVFRDRFIMLETMYWADEVRAGEELKTASDAGLDERERTMATTLISALSAPFEPAKYENRQRRAMTDMIQSKIQGRQIVRQPAKAGGQVIDLMEALRKSLEKTKVAEGAVSSKTSRRKRAVAGDGQGPSPAPPQG